MRMKPAILYSMGLWTRLRLVGHYAVR
jgi:hypothetical protein